jgi:ribosomal protein L16 Arg81 hydroxylase
MVCDLASLLQPTGIDAFFSEYWEQKHLAIQQRQSDHYGKLISLRDVDKLICDTGYGSASPRLRVVKAADGTVAHRTDLLLSNGHPDIHSMYQAFGDGFTIIINETETRWPAIAELCANLETQLNHHVGANLYLTPPSCQGFLPHYDDHDVFILQLAGTKDWILADAGVVLPLAEHPKKPLTASSPVGAYRLLPGDLLYIPRGMVHEARATKDTSMHLTVGIHVTRWIDLLHATVAAAAESDIAWRRSLPRGYVQSESIARDVALQLSTMIHDFAKNAGCENGLRRVIEKLLGRQHPVPDGHFGSLDRVNDANLETVVERRAHIMSRVFDSGARATIAFSGNHVSGPKKIGPALRFIAKQTSFRVQDVPGDLSSKEKLVLVKRLVREGFLRIGGTEAKESSDKELAYGTDTTIERDR